jgi:protein-tyrosine phosphatase
VRAFEGRWVKSIEPWKLAILSRPRSGERLASEIAGWRSAGIGMVVSMLTAGEVNELELAQESSLSLAEGLIFVSCPIPDRGVPSNLAAFRECFRQAKSALDDGVAVGVHCRAGIGRTGLFCASLLVSSGRQVSEAFEVLSASRGVEMPDTEQQYQWVEKHAKSL